MDYILLAQKRFRGLFGLQELFGKIFSYQGFGGAQVFMGNIEVTR